MAENASPFGPSGPLLRIGRVLEVRRLAEGGYKALAEKITEADCRARGTRKAGPEVIDRRKLKAIIDQEPGVSLSFRQLVALDHYLEQFGEGLARWPILLRPTLLSALGESPRITFFLGAKFEKARKNRISHSYLSRWDVSALREVQRDLNRMGKGGRIDFTDILLEDSPKKAAESLRSGWTRLLGPSGPSLVCLGAPRANHAAELMLSQMFGFPPLARTPVDEAGPPFHFVRPRSAHLGVPSAFAAHEDDVAHLDEEIAGKVAAGEAWALRVGERLHAAEEGRATITTYGVIAAQRRPTGQIWIVLGGLSGPGTDAAARCLEPLPISLPVPAGKGPTPVLWSVVRAKVRSDKKRGLRELVDARLLGGSHLYEPRSGSGPSRATS
jgi:hypothetical protein